MQAGTKQKNKKTAEETPLMKQYLGIKAKYPDALLLFRVGDFYETFGEDAVKTSKVLGIVLTKRANGAASHIELAGFPYHSLDNYLPKLVRAGYRVAICDQLEDPKLTKKIVKRGITELVTPGVAYNDQVLDNKSNNFLASVNADKNLFGISFLDVSTGEFFVAEGNKDYIEKLLQSFSPSEVLFQKNGHLQVHEIIGEKFHNYGMDDWVFGYDFGYEILLKHFNTNSLKGFGIENFSVGITAAGSILHYLSETQHEKVKHIAAISRIEEENHVWLDKFTTRNLEIFNSLNEGGANLLSIIDHTVSPMGSRLLKRWIALPLKNVQPIVERQEMVEYLFSHPELCTTLHKHISEMGDLERLISKVAVTKVNPRELIQLKKGLDAIIPVKKLCEEADSKGLNKISEQLNPCNIARETIEKHIQPDPPALVNKGNVINNGISAQLDELREIAYSGKDYLINLQKREIEKTGISSLKVGFNNVFGYYLEVTHVHKNKVPESWIRKQTLVNAERYITEELKEYESKILGAEEKILALEAKIFNDLVLSLIDYIHIVQHNASLIAKLDCLLSFAYTAVQNNYTRPQVNDSKIINIVNGRHPVIEKQLPPGEEYIANNLLLDNEMQQIIMITGPNMSGKSAILRQTALIVMLAQTGSFVPAEKAEIGITDKIFTRVGASDNISLGESTFMVEMNETASILNNLSSRSLVLLDEIGRGTSTYDGISIAWAIAEYLHEIPHRPKTLFATHYHELNDMANSYPRIKNYNVSVKELGNKVIFLRKLVEGGSEHSFGIHVARMAGMPKQVVEQADKMLKHLEKMHASAEPQQSNAESHSQKKGKPYNKNMQLSFFQLDDPVLSQIKKEIENININSLTPVEALLKLNEIQKLLGI